MPTCEDVKKGMEAIKGFTLGGLVPPMELTPADHEGGGWVQVWTVKGGKLIKTKEWFQGYRVGDPEAPRGRTPQVLTGGSRAVADALLSINNIEVVYDRVILVLKGVSIEVQRGRDHDAPGRQRRRQDDDA